jgi:LDH2 family malate/lactate/ureidoglycolate dehydrogenase
MAETDTAVTVSVDSLTAFIVSMLEELKMSSRNAALTADLMVRTDLRGVDSHGIGMLPRYVEWTRAGFVHPWAEPQVARDDLATALVDGQKGLGHPASVMAMELAITKAATYGVGSWRHFGACANYSMMAHERGMIGLAVTNSPFVAMVPTFARKPMMGTNPRSPPAGASPSRRAGASTPLDGPPAAPRRSSPRASSPRSAAAAS